MQIASDTVVSIDYRLHDSDGELLDSSDANQPLVYLHGHGNIVPGLEEALEGKSEGEQVSVRVPPEKGYGEHHPQLVQSVPRASFPEGEPPQPGMRFQAETESGTPTVITVTEVGDEEVTIDANHVLAGQELDFSVTVTGVRPATEEEVEHGHVHQASH